MRHRWAVAGVREVPWQCGCVKTREPFGAHFRAVYELGGVVTNYAPECPGKRS